MERKIPRDSIDAVFDAIQPHYTFLSFGILRHLTMEFLPVSLCTELNQYIVKFDNFSKSSGLKDIQSIIKEKLELLPAASLTTCDQTKRFVIKLNSRWEEMTLENFKRVLRFYFPEVVDLFSIIKIEINCIVVTLLIPTSLSQSLIDTINDKRESMSRLGILEVAIGNWKLSIRREDDDNLHTSLHESVKADGDSFEVSMLLQLGADPNSKNERGKSAVEIAIEGGHTQIKEMLLTGGGELIFLHHKCYYLFQ